MPVGGLTLRPGGDNWSWLARCSVPLPPGTSEWLGLVSHSQRRNTPACWLLARRACVSQRRSAGRSVTPLHHDLMAPYSTEEGCDSFDSLLFTKRLTSAH